MHPVTRRSLFILSYTRNGISETVERTGSKACWVAGSARYLLADRGRTKESKRKEDSDLICAVLVS